MINEQLGKRVSIGQKMSKYSKQPLGYGLYVGNGCIYASAMGQVSRNHLGAYIVTNNLATKCIGISIGDIIYGQITKIKQDETFLNILQVNSMSVNMPIDGVIRKQHVREKLIDQVVMIDSFRPGDIIRAKVISMGDSIRSLYLTTASEDLGVLVAKHEETGELMLPYDWTTMVDVRAGSQEKRKVAKPEMEMEEQ